MSTPFSLLKMFRLNTFTSKPLALMIFQTESLGGGSEP